MVIEAAVLEKPDLKVAVGLRTYLEITKVTVPSEAEAGTTVSAVIEITNVSDVDIRYVAAMVYHNDTLLWQGVTQTLWSGSEGYWVYSFIMPDATVGFDIRARYWGTDDKWHTDDERHITVALKVIGWQPLDSATLTVSPTAPPVVGWQPLASRTIGVASAAPPVVGWQPLASTTIGVRAAAPPPVGWVLLDSTPLAITAGPISPKYELIKHVIAPLAYFYEGDAEIASMTFTLIKGTTWLATDMANRFADQLVERGCTLLEGEFYKDASALLQDRYLVKIMYSIPAGVATRVGAIGFYIPPIVWNIIFYAALAALIAFLVSRAVNWVKSMFYSPPPLSEEVKAQWSRETLIGTITDLRPSYTPEELAGKTDQELRDLLDEIYEEEVPPAGLKWWQWCIIGGVGIAGGALAYKFISPVLPKKRK